MLYAVELNSIVGGVLTAGYQQQDRQVATVTNNQTQTLTSVSCQVRPLDWNMSRAPDAPENSTGIERTTDEDNTTTANRSVTTSVDQSVRYFIYTPFTKRCRKATFNA